MTDGEDKKVGETAKREEATLAFWNDRQIFEKSLSKDAPKGEYVFYDGPPFATGTPHYGHIVASVMKDMVPRFWTMRGYRVPRVWGWDCHGLPIENIVEKELGFTHKKDIKEYGIDTFNERCRESVMTYAHEWEKVIPRIGRFVDMKNAYRTMDKPFMESVWWVFKQLYDKGLVYEDYRSMHICPRCETTLSQSEVSEGYKDVKDISVTVKFKVKDAAKHKLPENTYLLAWTTTPWTLPGNVALAVGKDISYKLYHIPESEESYIIAEERAGSVFGATGAQTDGHSWSGVDLAHLSYEPVFDYYAKDATLKNHKNGWKVYAADFVTTESGTGIVHIAPAFGEDDMALGKREDLPFVQHVGMDGTMKPEVVDFAGMEVKPKADDDKTRLATDIAILKYLQEHGTFFSKENLVHSYPHCWRCDTPLLNYATSSWFVAVTKIKATLLRDAEAISWSPAHIKEGRFGKWLEGARDWSISRQRFWASVIPVWVCEGCGKQRVFGSAAELYDASGQMVDDLHKHVVDAVTFPCPDCGSVMRRVPDVLDTWFDSGSMPYGERHYPFEHKADFDAVFPAQFIAEGIDQTRAWFYYLHVLAGAVFGSHAFQNVIVNGIVLAEDGKKMSKKLKNYPDPMDVVGKYGADAMRLYLMMSPVVAAENLSFSERGVDEMAKKIIGRLGNVLAFYQLYADGTPRDFKSTNILDRWIIARLGQLVADTTAGFERYALDEATRPLNAFVDDLSVWYLRRSRDRFKGDDVADKQAAIATLRYVLHTLARVMAPAAPFLAEHLFQAVREEEDEESVHLASWPEHAAHLDGDLLALMEQARRVVSLALEARDKAGIKVRQPLPRLAVSMEDALCFSAELLDIIADEVNVKEVVPGPAFSLETTLTPELEEEGFVREFVRYVQARRKEMLLVPHDMVRLTVPDDERIRRREEVLKKTLNAADIAYAPQWQGADLSLDPGKILIGIERA